MNTKFNVDDKVIVPLSSRPGIVKEIRIFKEQENSYSSTKVLRTSYCVEIAIVHPEESRFTSALVWVRDNDMKEA